MADLVLEAFAGPGGWSTGLRMAGFKGTAVGVELDAAACRTATATGHMRVRADVAAFPLAHLAGLVDGLLQSPPCQAWSSAGDQLGKVDQPLVYERIAYFARGEAPPDREWADDRSELTAEPMRWAHALRPRWIALEQVPPVLPLWQYTAEKLRELGYRVWCGILSAEQYGVPQTRRRAILIARRDGLPVGPPEPTHQKYRPGHALEVAPDLFGDPLPPPVSMAEALGWHDGQDLAMRNGNQANACERRACEPAGTLYFGQRTNAVDWVVRQTERQTDGGNRSAEDPSLTITASLDNGNMRWAGRPRMYPAGLTGSYEYSRDVTEPSPTIKGAGSGGQYVSDGEETVRVTVQEAAVLQSFPPDYPWTGTKSEQYRMVGDAVPPLLAMHILRPLIAPAADWRAA